MTTPYLFCRWRGKGQEEKGVDKATGKVRVEVDPKYYRPTEVVSLLLYTIFGGQRNMCTRHFCITNHINKPLYRIAGYFRGVQFLWFSRISGYPQKLDPRNKYDCIVYNGHDGARPRKLNRENFADWPSAKLNPTKISRYTVVLFDS